MVVFTAIAATGVTVAGAIGVTVATASFTAFAVGLATQVVLGAALRALTPKPSFSGANRGYQVNSSGSALDHQIIYGKVRVGGAIVYDEATGSTNEYLHRIVAVSGHEIQSFDRIYINDEYIDVSDLGSDGNVPLVYSSDGLTTSDRYNNKLRIQLALGTSGQVANPDLVSESDGKWTSDYRLRGIAYMYVRMKFDANVYPSGIPVFTADVKGKKVYNPATTNTAWSDNPALCLRDYLTTAGYGLGEVAQNIDDELVKAAVLVCNQTNTIAVTTRYTCNGAFTTSSSPYDTINSLLTSMDGSLWYAQGKWRMKPAYWTTPVLDLNEDDLRSSISVSTRHSRRDNFNTVKGTFRGLESNWQTTDYPQVTNAAFVTADGGQESVADVDLPFTDNSIEAKRIALISLERNRQQLTVNASFGLKTLQLQVGDNVRLTNSRFGWDNKEFEVVAWSFGLTDGLDLQTQMTLRETAESVFDEVSDGVVYERDNTNLPNPFVGLAISNLSVSGGGRIQGDGTFINSAILSWNAAPNSFVTSYEVQWKALVDSSYSITTTTNLNVEVTPLVDNVEYTFRVRSVSSNGVNGPFSTINFTGGGDTTAPALPTSVSADGAFRYITVGWTNPADLDLKHVEVYENTSNTTVGANLVGISGGSEFVRSNLNLNQTLHYFLKSVDYSNNKSDFTSGVSATTTYLDDPDFENGIYTLFTEQGLYAILDVTSLPASGSFVGEKVFNRTDGKLYQWNGSSWETITGANTFAELNGQLAAAQIAVDAVTNAAIANDAIQEENIANLAISSAKIKANAVGPTQIANLAISSAKIAANAVGSTQIANLAITAGKVAASAIDTDKLANNAITETKIEANAVTTGKINANAITAVKINAGAVTATKIDANAVTADKILAGSVSAVKIASNAITSDKIDANAITADKILAGSISAVKIASNAITSDKIDANAITSAKIAAGSVTATEIAAGSIIASKIGANAVTANAIAANSVTTSELAANAVTANNIVGGTITGDKITANTITGGLIAASGIITNSAQINNAVITNAKIGNLAVDTIKIADRSVTSQTGNSFSYTTPASAGYFTASSLSISSSSGTEVLIGANLTFSHNFSEGTVGWRVLWNGSVIGGGTSVGGTIPYATVIRSTTTSSGTNTIQTQITRGGQGFGTVDGSMFILEALK